MPKLTPVASKPKFTSPTVAFIGSNGDSVILPVIGLKSTYGISFPSPPSVSPVSQIPPIHYTIPNSQANQLAAYWVNGGYRDKGTLFLAPRGWVPTRVAIGTDGSEVFSLVSPSDTQQQFSVGDDGGCWGCSVSDIGAYFPGMQQWAKSQGMPANTPPDFTSQDLLNKKHLHMRFLLLKVTRPTESRT